MPERNDAALAFLRARKSVPLTMLTGPAPDKAVLDDILAIAARVPDHGRLEPWRFIVFNQGVGALIADDLEALSRKVRPGLPEAEYERDRDRMNRAPLAVVVVFTPKEHETIPEWEMFLSAGAATMNLVSAATAHGFGANWVSGWFCDEPEGRALLGLNPDERVAGIVHIGTHEKAVADRPRPDIDSLTQTFSQTKE